MKIKDKMCTSNQGKVISLQRGTCVGKSG